MIYLPDILQPPNQVSIPRGQNSDDSLQVWLLTRSHFHLILDYV